MKRSNCWIAILFLLLLCGKAYPVEVINKKASSAANSFIKGVQISELDEGKQILKKVSWKNIEIPVLIDYKIIHESMFKTDIPEIFGYKQLLVVKVKSKASTELTKKYLLIAYKEKKSGIWKVYDFRESADTSYEAQAVKKHLGDTRYTKDQINYRSYGYWLTVDGQLKKARSAFLKASQLNDVDPETYVSQRDFDEEVEVLNHIIGIDK